MAVVFTKSLQLGAHAPCYRRFEEDLIKMSRRIGRPVPELKGTQIHPDGQELSWLVVCTIPAPELAPSTPKIIFEVMESGLEDGILRVMQLAIAKLANSFSSQFMGTPYRFYGKRDEEDRPVGASEDFVFAHHFQHGGTIVQHSDCT